MPGLPNNLVTEYIWHRLRSNRGLVSLMRLQELNRKWRRVVESSKVGYLRNARRYGLPMEPMSLCFQNDLTTFECLLNEDLSCFNKSDVC